MVKLVKEVQPSNLRLIKDMRSIASYPIALKNTRTQEIRGFFFTQGVYTTLGLNSYFRGSGTTNYASLLEGYGEDWEIFQFDSWHEYRVWLRENI